MRHMKRAAGVAVIATARPDDGRVLRRRWQRRRQRRRRLRTRPTARSPSRSPPGSPASRTSSRSGTTQNPDIQVEVQTGPNGNAGTYQNFFNQLKAGNAPDLGQIEYDALPNFRVQDGLENLAACEDVVAAEDEFVDWTWGQVTLGDGRRGLRRPAGLRPDGAVLPLRPVRAERHRRADDVGGVPRAPRRRSARWAGTSPTSRRPTSTSSPGFVWQAGGEWFAQRRRRVDGRPDRATPR